MSQIDVLRHVYMSRLAGLKSVEAAWPAISAAVRTSLGPTPSAQGIFELGNDLESLFRAPGGGRGQSDVSRSGHVWEAIVVWYLNFVAYGSSLLATRYTGDLVPQTLRDILTVRFNGKSTTSESDVVVFTVPGEPEDASASGANAVIRENLSSTRLSVVQCKTNWNENAQIPMLWDMVYRGIPDGGQNNVRVGSNGLSPRALDGKQIYYAFATVPTSTKPPAPGSLNATRVNALSGGNYWGRGSKEGVAQAFSQYLGTNFSAMFDGDVVGHLNGQLKRGDSFVNRYIDLSF